MPKLKFHHALFVSSSASTVSELTSHSIRLSPNSLNSVHGDGDKDGVLSGKGDGVDGVSDGDDYELLCAVFMATIVAGISGVC